MFEENIFLNINGAITVQLYSFTKKKIAKTAYFYVSI